MTPTSTDKTSPLIVNIKGGTFHKNNGGTDAILYLKSNSKLVITGATTFTENYAYERSSIVLADYLGSQVDITGAVFERNYGYLGGVFMV